MKKSRLQFAVRFKTRLPKHERAFSLHDALVALTVVSTVTSAALPSFQQLTASQRMSGAINSLVTALHLARNEAIRQGERATLCPSVNNRTCHNSGSSDTVWEEGYLLYIDRNGNHELDADDLIIRMFGVVEGLRVRSSVHRNHVTYQPNGMASGTNLTFTFCDQQGRGDPRAVIVSPSGRPRLSARNASGDVISCPASS